MTPLSYRPVSTRSCIYPRLRAGPKKMIVSGKSTRGNEESTKFRTAQGPKAGTLNTAWEE